MLHNHAQSASRQPPFLQTSPLFGADGPGPEQLTGPQHNSRQQQSGPLHSRDPSVTRGRPPTSFNHPANNSQNYTDRAATALGHSTDNSFSSRGAGNLETGLQRRTSASYGHHRQTSVIHGMQHSRTPSFNSPSATSPLTPESLLAASNNLRNQAAIRRGQLTTNELAASIDSRMSPVSAHSQGKSIDSLVEEANVVIDTNTQVRKRTANSRTRRGHGYNPSTVQQSAEPRTPGEYALHHLFHVFVLRADQKINQCLPNLDTLVTPVEQICGPGADAHFDQLISSLGHISRETPKPLVDSIMLWRKGKGDVANTLRKQIQQQRLQPPHGPFPMSLARRHTEPLQPNGEPTILQLQTEQTTTSEDEAVIDEYNLADKKATISVYILCRVLIAIFEQSSLASITPDLAVKLQDIVFSQLKEVEPAQILTSSLRLANWRIYGQVLGQMSRLDFVNVANRFTNQLDLWQQDFTNATGTISARDVESRAELLLLSMRHLRIEPSRELVFVTFECISTLSSLFVEAHGPRIKQAYCQLLETLLTPISSNPECFQEIPRWNECIDTINSRLGNMLVKVRHWNSGFPLSILLLCISPTEVFASQWMQMVANLAPKLKDRSTRGPAIQAICQLTWTYVARVKEPPQTTVRKLEEVLRITFPPGRKTHVVTESSTSDALVQLIRIVGYVNLDLCFRAVIYPLVNHETIQTTRDLRIEQMDPERMVVGIRGFLALLADLENGQRVRPPFPTFAPIPIQADGLPSSPLTLKNELINDEPGRFKHKSEQPPSTPVNVAGLDETVKKYYLQFCEILGKITILCDNAFGGQATLDQKFAISTTPKTPLVDAFSIVRKEDGVLSDQRQAYYELLHVAIQALPRCFTEQVPLNSLINLLCTGSAHEQRTIATSATESLKAIARQSHAQPVAIHFPRFIFHYDSQYSTMSDEGRLGPSHIESTLRLYLELLQIWIEQLKQKAKSNSSDARDRGDSISARALQMGMTNVIPHVDEIEAYGLFFLCSQSRRVRAFAVKVLQLVTQFDSALGKEEPSRIIKILESHSSVILDLDEDTLSVAERSRLQKDKRRSSAQNTLLDICSSEVSYDSTLWFKAFPNLIRVVFELCPHAIALSRGFVCDRLHLMQGDVESLARVAPGTALLQEFRAQGRNAGTSAEVLFDQWKLYLIMACVTLNSSGAQSQSQLANAAHIRKTSRSQGQAHEKLSSARALFSAIIPMLAAGPEQIRHAVVVALGSINRKLFRTLLESLRYAVIKCNDEAKARINAHSRTPSSPQRALTTERLRTEVTHVYKLTAAFLKYEDVFNDEWILNNLVNYTKELRIFLSDNDIQSDWRFQRLRLHYCGLVEEVFEGTNRTSSPTRWMPFEARKSAFALMEEWCGYSPEQNQFNRRDELVDVNNALNERTNANAAMEKEKTQLRIAALSSMAALCAGPVSIRTESNMVLSFNLNRILSWIDTIFGNTNDKMHAIGRRALRLLLLNNSEHSIIMEHAIESCYRTENQKALESYFGVVAEVLIQESEYPIAFWRVLSTVVFTLGHENRDIRMKSAHLLRTLDERQPKRSNLHDFDISISDRTRAVYKLAQFEYSKRLSRAHPDLAFMIFSEFSLHYKTARNDHQRNIVAAILPWLQTLELQLDSVTGGPTAPTYMLLANMFEITICSSSTLHNEVQALWQALATGPHAGNVQLILDFIIYLSMERREQNFVEYAKQIVVYLSTTSAGSGVLEYFMLQLAPKHMVNDKKNTEMLVPDTRSLPYTADLTAVLPTGNKQVGISLGQVSLVFLVDLMVPPVKLNKEDAAKLVHAVFILWDHYNVTVQEQAREMLVHLIHELVTTKINQSTLENNKQQIENIVDFIRRNDSEISWTYESYTGKEEDDTESRVPQTMISLSMTIVDIFGLAFDNFSDIWAKEALNWASICPVRHLACRSFQVLRCISVSLDARMLADMLARLSNTIADEQSDYQTFSMEILTTLKVIIGSLDPKTVLRYPQLFWTTCACLNTIHEREFFETLGMLEKLVDKIDLSDPHVTETMTKARPANWEGGFDGLEPLLYKGLKSADSLDRTLVVLHKFAQLPDCELVGTSERLLYSFLANLPRFLQDFDLETSSPETQECAKRLAIVAFNQRQNELYECLNRLATGGFNSSAEMLNHAIKALASSYLLESGAQSLIFMMGLLTNKTTWFRVKVMRILCKLIPMVDMKNHAITSHGPDLISPLLRLLQTEHSMQALEVMDHIMEVSGNPMERHHIRMSMASGTARAIRKEYERTQSLYGIPLPSGWSIPMPAVYSAMTRHNVHAVFYTCGDSESMKEQANETPDIEFHADEGYTDSYFPPQSQAGTLRSTETMTDANVSELVHTLDSMDDFFDDPDGQDINATPTNTYPPSSLNFMSHDVQEHNANLYDEQTAPILQRSLARTASSTSFHNGFAEYGSSSMQHQRGQPSMSTSGYSSALQSSFSSIDELGGPGPSMPVLSKTTVPKLHATSGNPTRPGLHARSITSPANQFPVTKPTAGSFVPKLPTPAFGSTSDLGIYADDSALSDSETFPPLTVTVSNSSKNFSSPGPVINSAGVVITPTSATDATNISNVAIVRRGIRRLTGGKSESQKEKEKAKDATRLRALSTGQNQGPSSQSPRVPRVPSEYLSATAAIGPSPNTSPNLS